MTIGKHTFKYKKDALAHFKRILDSYKKNQQVSQDDFDDLLALIEFRPDGEAMLGNGIAFIRVVEVRYKTKCFEIVRKDESTKIFSYLKSIHGKSSPFSKFNKACRETINEDLRNVKLAYFKKYSVKGQVKCQETGELCRWEELNIDHRQPNTLSVIVDRFIEVEHINIPEVGYKKTKDGVYLFADQVLSEKFRAYHKAKANLRIVMKAKNNGRSHQARIKRQKKDLTID